MKPSSLFGLKSRLRRLRIIGRRGRLARRGPRPSSCAWPGTTRNSACDLTLG